MANRHQRLDFQSRALGILDAAGVVVQRGTLVDIRQDAIVRALKPTQQPPEARPVHGRCLFLGEQLRLNKTP